MMTCTFWPQETRADILLSTPFEGSSMAMYVQLWACLGISSFESVHERRWGEESGYLSTGEAARGSA